jgi:hypothetical protein
VRRTTLPVVRRFSFAQPYIISAGGPPDSAPFSFLPHSHKLISHQQTSTSSPVQTTEKTSATTQTNTASKVQPATNEFMSIENLKTFGEFAHSPRPLFPAAWLDAARQNLDSWVARVEAARKPPGVSSSRSDLFAPCVAIRRYPHLPFERVLTHAAPADPFAEADEDTGETKQSQNYIHIRIQRA